MKKLFTALAVALAAATAGAATAPCDLNIQVVAPNEQMCSDPTVAQLLATRLMQVLTADGVAASESYGQLYISGRFDDLYNETVPGPPMQVAVHTTLTLMVADVVENMVFASQAFELRGVGTSQQRAYINALSAINANNSAFRSFLDNASAKTIAFFDKNYRQLLQRASTAAAREDFAQALYYCSLIPQCSKGYSEAESALLDNYQKHIDYEARKLIDKARSAFAVSPNADGAIEAYGYLNQVSPNSKLYSQAQSLAADIQKQVKVEYDFEVHQKYEDQLALKKSLIDAARQVGVAYGNGQKSTTTNLLWK